MKRVILEVPNAEDLSKCMEDTISRGEAPISLDLVSPYKQVGSAICSIWTQVADYVVVYADKGITADISTRIDYYNKCNIKVVYRYLTTKNSVKGDDRYIHL